MPLLATAKDSVTFNRCIFFEEIPMSFTLYMVGFLIFLGGVIWSAVIAGVLSTYIGIGALIFLGIGIFSAVTRTPSKDPS